MGFYRRTSKTSRSRPVRRICTLKQRAKRIEKRKFLMQIFDTNRTLFYYLFNEHVVEFMPIVYDPVIAKSIENYSEFFVNPQNAAFLTIENSDDIEEILKKRLAAGRSASS